MSEMISASNTLSVEHGGAIPGTLEPSFSLLRRERGSIPILLAVPHAGRRYPGHLLADMRDPEFATLRLEDRLVDQLGLSIAQQTGACLLMAHAPRAMLDLNRARDDVDWDMISGQRPHPTRHSQANRRARSGLGLVPRRLPGYGEIWRRKLSRSDLDARIEGIHQPYHAALARELEAIHDEWGSALLIDLHSMPPLKNAVDGGSIPRFVIGDRFGTSCQAGLVNQAYRYLEGMGQAVAHNRPYAGGYVLETHSAPRNNIHAFQLEICRSTYLDSRLEEISPKATSIARLVAGLVRELGAITAQIGNDSQMRTAAE